MSKWHTAKSVLTVAVTAHGHCPKKGERIHKVPASNPVPPASSKRSTPLTPPSKFSREKNQPHGHEK